MESTVIFALTPRAGRWNHRFIVPVGSDCSNQDLSQFVYQAQNRDQSVLSFKRTTVQSTTGRNGDEWLIVADARLPHLDAQTREKVQQFLEDKANVLNAIITNRIDWNGIGDALIVERPELSEWLENVNSLIGDVAADLTRQKKSSQVSFGRRKSLVILLLLFALFIALYFRPPLPYFQFGFDSNDLPSESEEPIAVLSQTNRIALAEVLRVDVSNMSPTSAETKLQLKLSELFEERASDESNIESSDSKMEDLASSTATIERSLRLLHFYKFGLETDHDADRLMQDDGVQKALRLLYPGPHAVMDPEGLLEDKVVQLGSIDARAFRRIAIALGELNAVKSDRLPQEGTYGDFFRDVAAMDSSLFRQTLTTNGKALPQFFLDEDPRLAKAMEQLFSMPAFAVLMNIEPMGQPLELAQIIRQIGKKHAAMGDQQLSATRIQYKQQELAGDPDRRKAFDLLLQIVSACQETLADHASDSTF